jgi:hypothetical protein
MGKACSTHKRVLRTGVGVYTYMGIILKTNLKEKY